MIRIQLSLFFLFILLPFLPAQEPVPNETSEKGVTPVQNPESLNQNQQTYAVVVGISDYQDPAIPDLRYAHKDAEAFAAFLRSPAGGSLDGDHLKVLVNEQATMAQFAIALDWLMEVAQENDRAIIYFSGHGDVEKKTFSQPGFLLCWDAPARIYMAGGAFGLAYLQEVISTLSIQTKAKTIVITDACRSGKLSGSHVGGAHLTNANLAKQYANEIKILSCQPDEYSVEGEQWGGGRGAFSYHLLDGLMGMADRNADQSVNLMEIRGYLEENVSTEVDPESQLPMVVGNGREKLADVFPELLEQLQEGRKGQIQLFTATDSRGIVEEVLEAADSNVVEMYWAFQEKLDQKDFLCDAGEQCADLYYEELSKEPQLERLHSSMRRNYAAALQDDAQQVMNRLLESNPSEVNLTPFVKQDRYRQYPELLRRAANLLGEKHYLYPVLMARSYWFEGFINDASSCACKDISNGEKVIAFYEKALSYQAEMPHAWFQLAAVYGIQMGDPDKGAEYANRLLEYFPRWTAIYDWMANSYLNKIWNSQSTPQGLSQSQKTKWLSSAKEWLDRGLAVDSNSILLWNDLGYYYNLLGEYEKEQEAYARSLAIDTLPATLIFRGQGYIFWGKTQEAEKAFRRAYDLDPIPSHAKQVINFLYDTGQDHKAKKWLKNILEQGDQPAEFYKAISFNSYHIYPKESIALAKKALAKDSSDAMTYNYIAIQLPYFQPIDTLEEFRLFKKAIKLDPENPLYHCNLALHFLRQNKYDQAKAKYLHALSLDSTFVSIHAGMYLLELQNGNTQEAEKWLREGMNLDSTSFIDVIFWLCNRYLQHPENTDKYFQKIEEVYPENAVLPAGWAGHKAFYENNKEAGFALLEKALKKGYRNQGLMQLGFMYRDLRLDKARWSALMQQYFPE